MIDLNCRSVVDMTMRFLPGMKERRRGAIIIVSSVVGTIPAPWFSAYSATKAFRSEFRKSAWAACIKRIYEIDPLECPKCKAQMRIIAFIQDEHSIKDIMRAEGLPDFRAPPAIPKFIDTSQDTYELSSCDSFTISKSSFI
jgi:NADP-dependent 3-hydroxy acid dehydrogenase YdfG